MQQPTYNLHNELYVLILMDTLYFTLLCHLHIHTYILHLVVHLRSIDKIYSPIEQLLGEGMGPGLEKREYLEPEAELVSVVFLCPVIQLIFCFRFQVPAVRMPSEGGPSMAALVNKFILTNTGDTESPYVMAVRTVDLVSLSLAEVLLSSSCITSGTLIQ